MLALFQDRRGRFSPLRTITLAVLIAPFLRLQFLWETGGLGGRPVREFTHGTGDWAVYFLLASLAITPLSRMLNAPKLLLLRRRIGVASACYIAVHLSLYVIDQRYDLLKVASEIALRFYLTIGFVTFLGLLALAITSTDAWVKRLGRRWKTLHRLAYPLTVLALLHYFLQSKADVSPAVFVAGLFIWEMLWRLLPRAWQLAWWPLPLLAIGSGVLTAGVEALWYGFATRIDPLQVLQANLEFDFGPSQAVQVALCGLLLSASVLLARWRQRRVMAA